jgi:hypothetical protein
MDPCDDEVWELVEPLRIDEYSETGCTLDSAIRKKGIGAVYYVREMEELGDCTAFDGIEIWLVLTKQATFFDGLGVSLLQGFLLKRCD